MTSRDGLLTLSLLFVPSVILAQTLHDRCPEALRYVGTLRGNGSLVEPLNKQFEISLPENATLDTSYQQTKVVIDNTHGKLRPDGIPKGIHIVPYGESDVGKEWAVRDPELKAVRSANGVTRYVFAIRLSCMMNEYAPQFGGCAVNVDVCYKSQIEAHPSRVEIKAITPRTKLGRAERLCFPS